MMVRIGKIGFIFGLITLSTVPFVWAAGSGAFRIYAADSEAAGKGFAYTGEADNPSAVFFNPSGLTQLKGANHLSIGGNVLQPFTSPTSPAGDEVHMQRQTFYVPDLFAVSDFGLEKIVFGFGLTSNWGLSTHWNPDSFSAYSAVETKLETVDNIFTMSYQVNPNISLGVGVTYDSSKLKKTKQINQLPGSDAHGELEGDDKAAGYTLSTLYKFNEQHQMGLIYRSPIKFSFQGTAKADNLTNDGALPLAAIFGAAAYSTPFKADLKLPQSVAMGYSYAPDQKWRLNFDVEWMDWSSVENEHVEFPDESNAVRLAVLDALTSSQRDWKSVFSYCLGGEYQWSEKLTLRAGGFYYDSPIPAATFESGVPTADMYGPSVGAGYQVNDHSTIDVAWSGLFYKEVNVNNTFGNALGANLDGTYKNMVSMLLITYGHKF